MSYVNSLTLMDLQPPIRSQRRSPNGGQIARLQIALHWIAASLILRQFLFNDAMTKAWDAVGEGLQPAFSPPVLAHVLVGAAILITAIWRLSINAGRRSPPMVGDNGLLNMLTHLALYALMILSRSVGPWPGSAACGRQPTCTTC